MNPPAYGFQPYYCIVCGGSWDDGVVHACPGSPTTQAARDAIMPSSSVNDLVLVDVEGLLDFPAHAAQSNTSEIRRWR